MGPIVLSEENFRRTFVTFPPNILYVAQGIKAENVNFFQGVSSQ